MVYLPASRGKISYKRIFDFQLKKHSKLPFFKRYLHAFAETPVADFIVVIDEKSYCYYEIILCNPKLSTVEINKLLNFTKKTKFAFDKDRDEYIVVKRTKKESNTELILPS